MIDDLDGPQFCDDRGFCICGNDCIDPWATPRVAPKPLEPFTMPKLDAIDLEFIQMKAKEKFVYLGEPYTVSWCDTEKGWAECSCGIVWHYKSACSLPRELWQDECSGDSHSAGYMQELAECDCGGGDPYIEHPCIGHDRQTGEPLLGPSKFIDYADRRY